MLNENIISNFIGIRNVSVNKIREKNKFIKIGSKINVGV